MFAFLMPKSNKTKCNSNDCEAGPSKRYEKDDSLINKDVNKDLIRNSLQSIEKFASNSTKEVIEYPRMKDCFNISTTYHGDAKNNTFHVNPTFIIKGDAMNVINNESSTIVDRTVTSEVFPNNKKTLELLWNDRSFDEHCLF